MRTVGLGFPPAELEAVIERRRACGGDRYDEVWEGEYHMAPAAHPFHGYLDQQVAVLLQALVERAGLVGTGPFNLGTLEDYRVPDRGLHHELPLTTWVPTAAVVVEIISPDDETWDKLAFYAAHRVEEVLVVDRGARRVTWLARSGPSYREVPASGLLGVSAADLARQISWPPD
ncbi:MAG: Uma2 family endonuclease [Acidimicrobiales bacterium]